MSFQAYLDNIEEKTGKTPNDFIAMAKEKGFDNPKTKAGDIVAWLKEEYGWAVVTPWRLFTLSRMVQKSVTNMSGQMESIVTSRMY